MQMAQPVGADSCSPLAKANSDGARESVHRADPVQHIVVAVAGGAACHAGYPQLLSSSEGLKDLKGLLRSAPKVVAVKVRAPQLKQATPLIDGSVSELLNKLGGVLLPHRFEI